MLDAALNYNRIGLIATAEETPIVLKSYLYDKKQNLQIESKVCTEALNMLQNGNQDHHDRLVMEMILEMEGKADVIVLSQYSIAHTAALVRTTTPILTGPLLTAKRCKEYLTLNR